MADNDAGGCESECPGDKARAPVDAVLHIAIIESVLAAGTNATEPLPLVICRRDRKSGLLNAVDRWNADSLPRRRIDAVVLVEDPSHRARERVFRREGQVRHTDACGIHSSRRAHARNHRNASTKARRQEVSFCRDVVDGVHDVVDASREKLIAQRLGVELLHRFDRRSGVNQTKALRHHLHFVLPDRALHRMKLPIAVGNADLVEVDQSQRPHSASRERFGGEGPDATHAHDENSGIHQRVKGGFAKETGGPVKAAMGSVATLLRRGGAGIDERQGHNPDIAWFVQIAPKTEEVGVSKRMMPNPVKTALWAPASSTGRRLTARARKAPLERPLPPFVRQVNT